MAADENAAARPSLADHIREGAARAGWVGQVLGAVVGSEHVRTRWS